MLRYALELVPKLLLFFLVVWGLGLIVSKTEETEPVKKPPHWSNLDKTRDPVEIIFYDYNTGEVKYRKEGPAKELKYKPITGDVNDPENLIHDSNLDIEDLFDYAYSY